MRISDQELKLAVKAGVLTQDQLKALTSWVKEHKKESSPLVLPAALTGYLLLTFSIAYFLATQAELSRLVAAGALTLLGTASHLLARWTARRTFRPGFVNLFYLLSIVAVPAICYQLYHFIADRPQPPDPFYGRMVMSVTTMAAGLIYFWKTRLPITLLPVGIGLWATASLLLIRLTAMTYSVEWSGVGAALLLFTANQLWMKRRFWLDLTSLLLLCPSLPWALDHGGILLATGLVLFIAAFLLARRIYLVFGTIGFLLGLYLVISRALSSPLAIALTLAATGAALIYASILLQRHRHKLHFRKRK